MVCRRVDAVFAGGGPGSALERVDALTVTGSRVAVEALGPDFAGPDVRVKRGERMDRMRAVMAKVDPTREIPRNDELWYFDEREDVGDWFRRHSWEVTVTRRMS